MHMQPKIGEFSLKNINNKLITESCEFLLHCINEANIFSSNKLLEELNVLL